MVEEATQDFVDFVQHHCNTNGSSGDGNSNSVLRHLAIIAAPHMAMFRSEGDTVNLAHVAANMLIGSSIESLHLSNKDWNPNLDEIFHRAMGVAHLIDVVSFFTTLLENVDQIHLSSL